MFSEPKLIYKTEVNSKLSHVGGWTQKIFDACLINCQLETFILQ